MHLRPALDSGRRVGGRVVGGEEGRGAGGRVVGGEGRERKGSWR